MYNTALSSRAAIALFTALKYNNKLQVLDIGHNNVTDDASDAITTALQKNSCLVELFLDLNQLTGEAIVNIAHALKDNNTLSLLWLPRYPKVISTEISSLQEIINMKRQSQGCQVTLEINHDSE